MSIPESERLTFRKVAPADAPFLLALMNDPGFLEHIGDRGIRTEGQARGYVTQRLHPTYATPGLGLFGVAARDSNTLMGLCGLIKRDFLEDVDLGFAFLPAYRGMGYALEAAAAFLDHGWHSLGLTRVVGIVSPENTRSIRLLHSLGMRFDRMIQVPGEDREIELHSVGRAWKFQSPSEIQEPGHDLS